jgi:hypothetical protein
MHNCDEWDLNPTPLNHKIKLLTTKLQLKICLTLRVARLYKMFKKDKIHLNFYTYNSKFEIIAMA